MTLDHVVPVHLQSCMASHGSMSGRLWADHTCSVPDCSGEVQLKDGSLLPTALKQLPYDTLEDRASALNEVEALYSALEAPHIVQCLAVFEHCDPVTGRKYLHIAME